MNIFAMQIITILDSFTDGCVVFRRVNRIDRTQIDRIDCIIDLIFTIEKLFLVRNI